MARKSRVNKQFTTKNNNNIYNVAFYIRISVEDEENNSIENQQVLLENYIKDKDNFKLIDTYIDELAIIRLNLINLELSRGLIKSYFFIF